MPKISVEVPQHTLNDPKTHIGTDKKFVSLSDAIRAALRKLSNSLDEIDRRQGRMLSEVKSWPKQRKFSL